MHLRVEGASTTIGGRLGVARGVRVWKEHPTESVNINERALTRSVCPRVVRLSVQARSSYKMILVVSRSKSWAPACADGTAWVGTTWAW